MALFNAPNALMLLHWPNKNQRRKMDYVQQLQKETRMATTQRLRSTAKSEQIWDEIPVLHFLEFLWSALLWAPTKGPNCHIGRLLSPINESRGEISLILWPDYEKVQPYTPPRQRPSAKNAFLNWILMFFHILLIAPTWRQQIFIYFGPCNIFLRTKCSMISRR